MLDHFEKRMRELEEVIEELIRYKADDGRIALAKKTYDTNKYLRDMLKYRMSTTKYYH